MAEDKYISDLTGEQLDAAFAKMANIDQYVSQAAVSANGAQTSASAASQSAAQASDSAATAGQQATAAAGSASNAADSAEQAQASASAAAQSAQKATESAAGMSDFVQQAQASVQAAAQSASQAESSAGTAESAAQAAARSEASVSANAEKAEQAATAAAASEAAAQNSAAQAAGSASDAAASAGLIQDNLDAIQAAPGAAQAAQQAASDAQAAQTAAEDAARRAEQIADFEPSDFATAAQGAKADTAVQSVNGKTGTALTLEPGDVGAATAAQGQKADTAVQTVNGNPPDSAGNVQLDLTTGTVRSINGQSPDGAGNVELSASDVGAATEAQGTLADTAVQPADLSPYAKKTDIPDELPSPQPLNIQLGQYGATTSYDGSLAKSVVITPASIDAATAAQGEKADSALQPDVLNNYYTNSEADEKFAPKGHSSSMATYGLGSSYVYGHVKLSDTPGTSGASGGTAATPKCIQDALAGLRITTIGLLWTNPAPESLFNAQKVSVNLAAYDEVLIIAKPLRSENSVTTPLICPIGMSGYLGGPYVGATDANIAIRKATVSANGVTFSIGYYMTNIGQQPTSSAGHAVPIYIYGVKF